MQKKKNSLHAPSSPHHQIKKVINPDSHPHTNKGKAGKRITKTCRHKIKKLNLRIANTYSINMSEKRK